MALFLTGTQDQALLATVVRLAWNVAQRDGGYVGRTALQKIMYFLQVLGVPMGYKFSIHHFGPFSDDLVKDLEWLEADEVVRNTASSEVKYYNYGPGSTLDELVIPYQDLLAPHLEKIGHAVTAFVPLSPRDLELLATMHYAFRSVKAWGYAGPFRDATLQLFREFKGDKFRDVELTRAYDRLERARLVEK